MNTSLKEQDISFLAEELQSFIHYVAKDKEPKELQTYIEVIKGIMLKHIHPPKES